MKCQVEVDSGIGDESKSGVEFEEWNGRRTPYDVFVKRHGERGKAFLDKLGIREVPSNQATLDPMLLEAKLKRHADKVIMERYGVKKSDPTTPLK